MAGDLSALAAKWLTLAAAPTSSRLDALNTTNVTGPTQDIRAEIVENLIVAAGKMPGLRSFVYNTPASPNAAALLAANYLVAILRGADGGLLKAASEPTLLATLSHLSDDARTGITAGNVTALTNLCSPSIPWWQANGFSGPITVADLIAAGNLS